MECTKEQECPDTWHPRQGIDLSSRRSQWRHLLDYYLRVVWKRDLNINFENLRKFTFCPWGKKMTACLCVLLQTTWLPTQPAPVQTEIHIRTVPTDWDWLVWSSWGVTAKVCRQACVHIYYATCPSGESHTELSHWCAHEHKYPLLYTLDHT